MEENFVAQSQPVHVPVHVPDTRTWLLLADRLLFQNFSTKKKPPRKIPIFPMIVLVIKLKVGSSHLLTDGGYGFVSFNLQIVQI